MSVGVQQAINPFDFIINQMMEDQSPMEAIDTYRYLSNAWQAIYDKIESSTMTEPSPFGGFQDEPRPQPHLIRTADVSAVFKDLMDLFKKRGGYDFSDFENVVDYMMVGHHRVAEGEVPARKITFSVYGEGTDGAGISSFSRDMALAWNSPFALNNRMIQRRGDPGTLFEEWKKQLYQNKNVPAYYRPFIDDLDLDDARELWKDSMSDGITEDNEFFSDFIESTIQPLFIARGQLPTMEEITKKQAFREELAGHPDIDLENLTPQQRAIFDKYLSRVDGAIKDAKAEAVRSGEPWTKDTAFSVATNLAIDAANAMLNPDQEPLTQAEVEDIFNAIGIEQFGVTLGDLRRPASSDEQYLLRLAYSKSLENIQAMQAVGETVNFMDIISKQMGALPDPDEIGRRQELRFGQMPPGTVVVGEAAAPPPTVTPQVPSVSPAVRTLDEKVKEIMRERSEVGDPISLNEAEDIARLEMGDDAPPIEAEAPPIEAEVPEEPPQITADTENLRRYNNLKVILDMPDGQEKQDALRQFVTDEGLSQRLLQGKPVLDAEGNQVLDADGNPAFTDAPINEAAVVMASVQEGAMGAIMGQREEQVGKSLEDVQARIKIYDDLEANVQNAAKDLEINLDEYAGGNQILDDLITLRDEGQEAGMLAKKQMAQREKEEQIREEGFPVDITQLPSSQEKMAVGAAGASKAYLEAQEKERQRQAQMAATRARRAEADAATRTLGGRLGA